MNQTTSTGVVEPIGMSFKAKMSTCGGVAVRLVKTNLGASSRSMSVRKTMMIKKMTLISNSIRLNT